MARNNLNTIKYLKKKIRKLSTPNKVWIGVFLILIIGAGIIFFTSYRPQWSLSQEQKLQKVVEQENKQLDHPHVAYGGEFEQKDRCREVIVGMTRDKKSTTGIECDIEQTSVVYARSDSDKVRIKNAARNLNDALKVNGWQPEGGHADISFWTNHLMDNSQTISRIGSAYSGVLGGNTFHKKLSNTTECTFSNHPASIEDNDPVGVVLMLYCRSSSVDPLSIR